MNFYTSSYTEHVGPGLSGNGVGIQYFNINNETSEITLAYSLETINPGYFTLNPRHQLLYTFQERLQALGPHLLCFQTNLGHLELVGSLEINGGLPCHILHIKKYDCLIVSCYETGNFLKYELDENGVPLPFSQNIKYSGGSINKDRQEGPHAHLAHYDEAHDLLLLTDLGNDKIYSLKYQNARFEQVAEVSIPAGGGPRHLVQHPDNNYCFVSNEMTGNISILKWENEAWQWIKNISVMTQDHNNVASASAIKLSKNGRYIYCGVRSTNSISILHFDAEKEDLTLIDEVPTLGITPRDFEISPDGSMLIVGNQDSASMVSFSIQETTGKLELIEKVEGIRSVCCIKFE
ncbi:lactonase family protein [Flammeovirga sp. MY04]|uniref:lactonase family protein n=1 Tax=Flammeovirga sp. MY04 TaxID=1191459 RepID=UPI0008062521|nr:beta-propeller fold lactonase family protein [Flammeovirga sp. MY04]ANQ49736.1 lactonase family protein [Flammeovirga sp. MY04]